MYNGRMRSIIISRFWSFLIVAVLLAACAPAGQAQPTATDTIPPPTPTAVTVNSFSECEAAGFPVMESYPRQCSDGSQTFVEDIGNELEKLDLIRIDSPRPNETIRSPLTLRGEARGTWYFEGDFPVVLLDAQGNSILTSFAFAEGVWMTEEFVPFRAELAFEMPPAGPGTLILQKANPSGLPENDDALEVPIIFGP